MDVAEDDGAFVAVAGGGGALAHLLSSDGEDLSSMSSRSGFMDDASGGSVFSDREEEDWPEEEYDEDEGTDEDGFWSDGSDGSDHSVNVLDGHVEPVVPRRRMDHGERAVFTTFGRLDTMSATEFQQRMRMPRRCFAEFVENLYEPAFARSMEQAGMEPRQGDALSTLYAVVFYLAHGGSLRTHNMHSPWCHTLYWKLVHRGVRVLAVHVAPQVIVMPSGPSPEDRLARLRLCARFKQLFGVTEDVPGDDMNLMGIADGSFFQLKRTPDGEEFEAYKGRKDGVGHNVLAICSPDYEVLWIDAYRTAAFNDQGVWNDQLFMREEGRFLSTFYPYGRDGECWSIMADAGYSTRVETITPFKPSEIRRQAEQGIRDLMTSFNREFSSVRVRVENLFARVKLRWLQLDHKAWLAGSERVGSVLTSAFVLHNVVQKYHNVHRNDPDRLVQVLEQREARQQLDGMQVGHGAAGGDVQERNADLLQLGRQRRGRLARTLLRGRGGDVLCDYCYNHNV